MRHGMPNIAACPQPSNKLALLVLQACLIRPYPCQCASLKPGQSLCSSQGCLPGACSTGRRAPFSSAGSGAIGGASAAGV